MTGDPKDQEFRPENQDFVPDQQDFVPDQQEQAPPQTKQPQGWGQWAVNTARGITKRVAAPVQQAGKSLSYLAQGDLPAWLASNARIPGQAMGAVTAPLSWIPNFDEAVGTLAKPGVNAWNEDIRPGIEKFMDSKFPNRPRVSRAATEEANALGQESSGAASSTLIGELAGGAVGAAGGGLNALRRPLADKLTSAAYKIPPTVKGAVRQDVLHTLQKYDINPTEGGGLPKWQAAMDALEKAQTVLEDNVRPTSYRVPMGTLLRSLNEVQKKWSVSDLPKDFQSIVSAYRRAVRQQNKPWLGMDDMIAMKRNLQYQLKNVFDRQQRINPTLKESVLQEAKHAIERELKVYLEKMIPDYKEINGEMKALMDAKPFVERATNRLSNYDAVSAVKDMAGAGTGAILGGAPGAAIGVAAERMILHPPNWSKAANVIAPQYPTAPVSTAVKNAGNVGGVAGAAAGFSDEEGWQEGDGFQYRILPEGQ